MARFAVSDKYAGKKGPCPKCKKEIVVPDKTQEVVIHAPEMSGPKDSKGVSVLKPISRREFKLGRWALIGSLAFAVAMVCMALAVRTQFAEPPTLLLVLGVMLTAPTMVMFAYTFLRDDELEGYSGQEYAIRTAICSAIFAGTWLIYYLLARYFENNTLAQIPVEQMAIFLGIMIALGTVTSLATFELETLQAAMHYLAFLAATVFLALIVGLALGEPLADAPSKNAVPAAKKRP